jgi:hypothetical protein
MTSLWFVAILALAIAVAGSMKMTMTVVTISPNRANNVRMTGPPNKAEEAIHGTLIVVHVEVGFDVVTLFRVPLVSKRKYHTLAPVALRLMVFGRIGERRIHVSKLCRHSDELSAWTRTPSQCCHS